MYIQWTLHVNITILLSLLEIFSQFGNDDISSVGNREKKTEGSVKMKVKF